MTTPAATPSPSTPRKHAGLWMLVQFTTMAILIPLAIAVIARLIDGN